MLLCNLGRAEGIMRRYLKPRVTNSISLNDLVNSVPLTVTARDALKLCYHPGEVCHTMTSSSANLYWLCVGQSVRLAF